MELPHSNESEMAVLGSILLDRDAAFLAYPMLKTEYFFNESHRKIYDAIQSLISDGSPVDFVTLANRLKEKGELDTVGGPAYLATLMESSPTSLHIEYYANSVRDYYRLRSLINTSSKVISLAYNSGAQDVGVALDGFSEMLFEVFSGDPERSASTSRSLMREFWTDFEKRYNNPGKFGISTGYLELDAILNGFNAGDLVVVAGRPSQGKSALAAGSILALAEAKVPSILFSYEMSRLELSQRFVSMQSNVALAKIRSAVGLSQKDLEAMSKSVAKLNDLPLYIDNSPFGDLFYLSSAIRRYVFQYKCRVIFIDYLQIIPTHTEDLTNEYGKITRTLKILARSLNITVVLLSQLNRSAESRSGGKPKVFDLRQSGRIEEDSDVVLLIHRKEESPEDAEIIIGKNRNGPCGMVNLYFDSEKVKFIGR